uniref:Cellular communication network factor 6 n=1 Tax=Sinocyclocheilus grahami TaxID=75366 RepID=A0A672SY79_SINGR
MHVLQGADSRQKQREATGLVERRQFCSWPCKCGVRPPCAPGVSSILDGCGWCKTCARQIWESCNERDVCDPHKSMYCDFSKNQPRYEVGVCAYMMGVGCDLNGAHYDNGQAFQPSPLYKCTCIAGAIGCTPAFIQKPGSLPAGLKSDQSPKHQQDTTYRTMSDECGETLKPKTVMASTSQWANLCLETAIPFCCSPKQTNSCSECLKLWVQFTGKTCRTKFQASKAQKLSLSGCTSVKKHRPIYCGTCTDKRCCIPNKSKMVNIEFHCKGGSNVRWRMQWITSCVCQRKCNDANDMFSELHLI